MGNTTMGGCLCGACHYEFGGDIKFAIRCYCRDCQHASGGGSLPQVGVSGDGFKSSGPIKTFRKASNEGNQLEFSFCGNCGSPLFKSTSKMPGIRVVCAGSLATAPNVDFATRVFEDRRQVWDDT